jgi:hypothetical protein
MVDFDRDHMPIVSFLHLLKILLSCLSVQFSSVLQLVLSSQYLKRLIFWGTEKNIESVPQKNKVPKYIKYISLFLDNPNIQFPEF